MKEKKKKGKIKAKTTLILAFTFSVALVLLIAVGLVAGILYAIIWTGAISEQEVYTNMIWIILSVVFASAIIGSALMVLASFVIFRPINRTIDGLDTLSKGDYTVKLKLGKIQALREVSESFNALSTELANTEILRSDFINNFSHEFKTPIVSMKGLIALLKKGNVSEEKRKQYIEVIESELDRLSSMSTNVLNLSKIENQSILTGAKKFNLSEQIRTCILLLEKKWVKKDLDLKLDFDEFYVVGNEDLLKEVWLNLLDNAVKFSFDKGELDVSIKEDEDNTLIKITNDGEEISKEDAEKIFNKFYRVDRENNSDGNGIGLSIVKHIVALHGGEVFVESENRKTTFTVSLPRS